MIYRNLIFTLLSCFLLFSCSKTENLKQKSTQLRGQAVSAQDEKDYTNSLRLATQALEIDQELGDTIAQMESLYILARSSALSGNFSKALEFGESGKALCQTHPNYALEYKINNILSWSYFSLGTTPFSKSLEHQQRQLFVVDQLEDEGARALVYNNYGYDNTVAGIMPLQEVIRYTKQANDIYAKTENNAGRWYTLMNLTWQHRLLGDFGQSEEYGRLASKQALADQDRHAIIEANTNLGETLLARGKTKEAAEFYLQAKEWSGEEADRDKYVFDVYYARYLWQTGEREKAIELLENAVLFLESSELFYEMLGRSFLTEIYYNEQRWEDALEQINHFESPRGDYFSQESIIRTMMIKAALLQKDGELDSAEELKRELIGKATQVDAEFLIDLVNSKI